MGPGDTGKVGEEPHSDSCSSALGVLAQAPGLCMAFCCLGVPSKRGGTGHVDHYSYVTNPLCFWVLSQEMDTMSKGLCCSDEIQKQKKHSKKPKEGTRSIMLLPCSMNVKF